MAIDLTQPTSLSPRHGRMPGGRHLGWPALAILVAACTAPLPDDPTTWETDWVRHDNRNSRLQNDIDHCKAESTEKDSDGNAPRDPKRVFLRCMESLGWEREEPYPHSMQPVPAPVSAKPPSAVDVSPQAQRGPLKEDPALACYRNTSAPVTDGRGVVHRESLFVQLGLASGIARAELSAGALSYDCSGTFYDKKGAPVAVPAFPTGARTDADVRAWLVHVTSFYASAFVDAKSSRTLSPGKARLCVRSASVHAQASPDASLLQAFEMLQQAGGEAAARQDPKWLTNIVAAGTAKSCSPLPRMTQRDIEVWFVPEPSARSFYRAFRDCAKPDSNQVGGCPHTFDAPGGHGNHVNAEYLFDGRTAQGGGAWFIGD